MHRLRHIKAVHENLLLFFPRQIIWPWTLKNAIQHLYLHLFTTKFVAILLTLKQKCHISLISNVQKVRHLEHVEQTDEEPNKAAVWSSANNSNKKLIFLKFDYRKQIYVPFTFEMDIGKGVKENDIGGAVLIYIAGQPRSIIMALIVSMHLIGKILDRCKYYNQLMA